jgi:signal transduction histidine kinase
MNKYDNHGRSDTDKQRLLDNVVKEMSELSNRLRKSERVKSQFLSNVRNEINNPLMAIMCMAASIRDAHNLDLAAVKEWANTIHREAFNLNYLLGNIVLAAEIEAGEASAQASTVNISKLIDYHIRLLKQNTNERNIQIVSATQNAADFNSDGQMLQRIIMNLLHEAVEGCPSGKKISITANVINNEFIFTVAYDAPLVSESTVSPVYNRVRHVNPALENSVKNYGLSLSVVKELTDRLGGSIEMESELNLSRVTVRIPALNSASLPGSDILFGQGEMF